MVKEFEKENFDEIIKSGITFFDFYADWCMPCKMMIPVIEELSEIKKDVTFYKLNVDLNMDIARKFNVQSIPRFLIFKDSKLVKTLIGVMEIEDLIDELNNI